MTAPIRAYYALSEAILVRWLRDAAGLDVRARDGAVVMDAQITLHQRRGPHADMRRQLCGWLGLDEEPFVQASIYLQGPDGPAAVKRLLDARSPGNDFSLNDERVGLEYAEEDQDA